MLAGALDELIDTAAVREALREARFHPALRSGEPVSSWVTVRLHSRLEE